MSGLTPRRNPEIVVCVLLEEGEHGYLAARGGSAGDQGIRGQETRQPQKMANNGKVDVGALWSDPEQEDARGNATLHGGRFTVGCFRQAGRPGDGRAGSGVDSIQWQEHCRACMISEAAKG